MRNKERGYISVSIPVSLAKEVDRLVGKYGYSSRAEIVKDAIRSHLRDIARIAMLTRDDEDRRARK